MHRSKKSTFAGTITYQPRTALTEEQVALLRSKLIDKGLVQEPENPAVVIDWYFEARDQAGIAEQSYVVLFRDGGDAEEPACAFYRKDVNRRQNRTAEYFHIPRNEDQPELAAAWKWMLDPSGSQLRALNDYVDRLMEDEPSWEILTKGG